MRKKEARQKTNWIYSNFILSLKYVANSKNYILFAFLLLLISVSFGFAFPSLFEKQVLKVIQELVKETEGLGTLQLISFIIFNNMKSAFFGLIFGVFFAIAPFTITLVNGYVLGFVMQKTISNGGIFVLWRLFPHGIFEIPAVLISIGLGLKLGMFLFNKDLRKKGFWNLVKISLKVFLLIIVPLLVIAGMIEGLLIVLLK